MNVRPYQRGDAPGVRKAYLQGLILQDGTFVTEGKEFSIHDDDVEGPHAVSGKFLFVEGEER